MKRPSVELVIQGVPLLAPVPTAFVVGQATVRVMHWPVAVAVVAALIIEGLGFTAMDTAVRFYDYNKSKRKIDPAAPAWVAYVVSGIYLSVALTLTVLLDIVPGLATYAPGVFPFLGVLGALLWGLRTDHGRRTAGIREEKERKREERVSRRLTSSGLGGAAGRRPPSGRGDARMRLARPAAVPLEQLLGYWREHPKASDGEVSRQFGIHRQAVQQRRVKLIEGGKIRMNGGGVEVVGDPMASRPGADDAGLMPARPVVRSKGGKRQARNEARAAGT